MVTNLFQVLGVRMCIRACIRVCVRECVCKQSESRASRPLELVLQAVVSHWRVLESKLWVFGKSNKHYQPMSHLSSPSFQFLN